MLKYDDFINSKSKTFENMGIDIDRNTLNPNMFEFQKDIVRWALKKRKSGHICRMRAWKNFNAVILG